MTSIIITYIDEHDFLKEAVESVLEQKGIEMEVIVVCNKPYLPEDYDVLPELKSNFRFIHESKPGSAYARNAGLHNASGEWMQFLDVDDLILQDKIVHQSKHTDADVVLSPHIYQFINGKKQPSKWTPDDLWVGILDSGLGSTSSMLWKRKSLISAGGWNTEYKSHQEYELLFRMASKGYTIIPETQYETIVRERTSGSLTQQTKSFRAEEGIKLRENIWSYLETQKLANPERLDAFRQYIFKQIRATYRRDPKGTEIIFKKYFSDFGFTPQNIGIPFYTWIYRALGFTNTESLFHFYSEMRDKYLPILPKNK